MDAHPTAAVTDMYLEMREGNDIPVLHTTARTDLDGPSMVTLSHVLCSSLVWSARALNRASSNDRKRLRDAAKTLHVIEFLRSARTRCSEARRPNASGSAPRRTVSPRAPCTPPRGGMWSSMNGVCSLAHCGMRGRQAATRSQER